MLSLNIFYATHHSCCHYNFFVDAAKYQNYESPPLLATSIHVRLSLLVIIQQTALCRECMILLYLCYSISLKHSAQQAGPYSQDYVHKNAAQISHR